MEVLELGELLGLAGEPDPPDLPDLGVPLTAPLGESVYVCGPPP